MVRKAKPKTVETLTHTEASRANIPTAEHQVLMRAEEQSPIRLAYQRRNRDLDPQFVWRGKDEQDMSELVVPAPPLYIQEKVHPKVLIDDLLSHKQAASEEDDPQLGFADLFADFNGLPNEAAKTEFYQHDANWSNRMILGDSLQVMASLAEREGLRGKVQCIYMDPPYGIKFNSNFQWSTTSRDVKDGKTDHITREPEQVKAFRDTWRDGIHSYLSYLRDRLTVARDLLTESGSVFVQIGDENVHRVRALMDEVFGEDNFISEIVFTKTRSLVSSDFVTTICDYILWYAKNRDSAKGKMRKIFLKRREFHLASHFENSVEEILTTREYERKQQNGEPVDEYKPFKSDDLIRRPNPAISFDWQGRKIAGRFRTNEQGITRALQANRILFTKSGIRYKFFLDDFAISPLNHLWQDVIGAQNPTYVVQTNNTVIQRCILMTTDPGDIVLDPTCGSGTTAYVAEQWGRRWITIDTSRVALALARARIMGARYPYYILADSREGQRKEAEISRTAPAKTPTYHDIRQGFVYQRVPHITLRAIANNTEIDTIWQAYERDLAPLRQKLSAASGQTRTWEEWEIPRQRPQDWPTDTEPLHTAFWQQRRRRQQEIDAAIAAKADYEYLYDKPYEDRKTARVAGPFTVESISPHRVLDVDENGEFIDREAKTKDGYRNDFARVILENLLTAGVQQAHKEDRIHFAGIRPWPGDLICAESRLESGERAAIFIGPEFGTVSRPDLVQAAREAAENDFELLITCAFNYDAHTTEFEKLGRLPVLKARMNADLHMADTLKKTAKGNLFVIFGEPDISVYSDRWLVARNGSKIANYALAKELSGLGSLEEINQLGRDGLFTPTPLDTCSVQVSQTLAALQKLSSRDFPLSLAIGVQVTIHGIDVFHPNSGEIRSHGPEGIACWFIDSDYNEESFFVRHAYFLGASDPYRSLKTTLKAEINAEAWSTLYSNISRPFDKPASGRIAVKVINHLGDEIMKVFRV